MSSEIDKARYILFGTRKRDGSMVDTPVWFAGNNGLYYAFSAGNAGKVKRLRNFPESRLAPSTATGKAVGDSLPARSEIIVDPDEIDHAYKALLKKYGWQMRSLDAISRVSGKINKRAFIKIVTD